MLTLTNMIVWHVLAILSVQALSSGRAAILGYTMPVFSALWGMAVFGQRLSWRQGAGVAAAALGVVLLLWHEFGRVAGSPWAAERHAGIGGRLGAGHAAAAPHRDSRRRRWRSCSG